MKISVRDLVVDFKTKQSYYDKNTLSEKMEILHDNYILIVLYFLITNFSVRERLLLS